MSETASPGIQETPPSRAVLALSGLLNFAMRYRVDLGIVGTILFGVGLVLPFVEEKLAFLNFFFLPVLAAGYVLNARTAVLTSLLSIAWVTLFVGLNPAAFGPEADPFHLYLHLVVWSGFLILSGALVGSMAESLHLRVRKSRENLREIQKIRLRLDETNRLLRSQNSVLESSKDRIAEVLRTAMDPRVARLAVDRKLRTEKRAATVMFADLVSFTESTELRNPESVIGDLNRVFSAMEPVLARFRGHLDKFLGDGLMAEFGTPYTARNHPLLAMLAATKMQERMAYRQFPWQMRIGIASGTTWVGLMGTENRKNFTAVGDTVNLASRLEKLCPIGSVCIDEATHAFAGRWFFCRRIREGLSGDQAREIEARLELLADTIDNAPTARLCIEAADLCSQLGNMQKVLKYHRMALELDPTRRDPIEKAVASALLTSEERAFLSIKGKNQRVAAYQILGLKDPLEDGGRLPMPVVHFYKKIAPQCGLPDEELLAIEALDGSIGHAKIVAALSAAVADGMGLDEEKIRAAFIAGYLHDIGKKRVPEHLLNLDEQIEDMHEEDRRVIRGHIDTAPKIVEEMELSVPRESLAAIRQHHERFDGSGYPNGLKGAQIGLLARIIPFADIYEARTSQRPYQEAWTPRAVLTEIHREMHEGHLDPQIGKVFLQIMRQNERPSAKIFDKVPRFL